MYKLYSICTFLILIHKENIMDNITQNYDYLVVGIGYFISRQCSADWCIEDGITNFIDITYVYSGEAYYKIDGKNYYVSKGDLLCIPKHSRRSATTNPDNPMMCYPVNFQLNDFDGNEITLPFPLIANIGIIDPLIKLYKELNIVWTEKKPGYHFYANTIFSSILYKLFGLLFYRNDQTFMDSRIQRITNYISEHYTEKLTVDALAELVCLNPVYFGILFKENMGCSVKKYINQIKINHAENLLLSGEFTITETALKCGFDDIYYFSKLFKSVKGYPPSQAKL